MQQNTTGHNESGCFRLFVRLKLQDIVLTDLKTKKYQGHDLTQVPSVCHSVSFPQVESEHVFLLNPTASFT